MRHPEQRPVELSDGRTVVIRCWPGDGVPVLLVHGLLDSSVGWDRLASRLPQSCLVPDLPGFGGSDMPLGPRLPFYADDIVEAAGRLGVERFTLVGHSLGGAVAGAIADSYPDRIASLVLLAPAAFGRIRAAEALLHPGTRGLVGGVLPWALANPFVLSGAYMAFVSNGAVPEAELLLRVVRRARLGAPATINAMRAVVAAGLAPDGFHTRAMAYDGPARVIWGDRDRLVPIGHLDGVRTALPQADVEVWPGMGHHPQRERPRQLAERVSALQVSEPGVARQPVRRGLTTRRVTRTRAVAERMPERDARAV